MENHSDIEIVEQIKRTNAMVDELRIFVIRSRSKYSPAEMMLALANVIVGVVRNSDLPISAITEAIEAAKDLYGKNKAHREQHDQPN